MKQLSLMLLILALGCIGTETAKGYQSEGLKITRLEPDIPQVQEGGRAVVAMLAQNTGLFPAKRVEANLFMHDSFETAGNWIRPIDDLKPASTELNTPGGTAEVLWDTTAPKIARGENTYPFNFLLDLSYDYESSGFREIPVLSYDRVLQLKQENKPLPHGQENYQNGPLGISIKADDPVILKGDNGFTIKVILTLTGGYVKLKDSDTPSGDCGTERLNCITSVELQLPDGLSIDTGNDADGDPKCAFDASGKKSNVKLVEGKETVLSCRLISKDAEEFNPTIKARTAYRHHVRGETPITVKK